MSYTICIIFFTKIMGIQLNTLELRWARPWSTPRSCWAWARSARSCRGWRGVDSVRGVHAKAARTSEALDGFLERGIADHHTRPHRGGPRKGDVAVTRIAAASRACCWM